VRRVLLDPGPRNSVADLLKSRIAVGVGLAGKLEHCRGTCGRDHDEAVSRSGSSNIYEAGPLSELAAKEGS
jgi:hypothetical protein